MGQGQQGGQLGSLLCAVTLPSCLGGISEGSRQEPASGGSSSRSSAVTEPVTYTSGKMRGGCRPGVHVFNFTSSDFRWRRKRGSVKDG